MVAVGSIWIPLPREDFALSNLLSMRIVDRRGLLLRECLSTGEGFARWTPLGEMAPALVQATVAVEDRRFRFHPGVDPLAVGRSILENIRAGAFRSGGSTLTQQVIRNVYHHPRTVPSKLLEMWYALRLERMLTKDEVLEQYLNRAPYGNQLLGAQSAARAYFGKPARDLSLAESAFLAGLPNAPSAFNPRKSHDAAVARQRVVLRRMREQGIIDDDAYALALAQPLSVLGPENAMRAPHATNMILARYEAMPAVREVRTTLDYPLQQQVQQFMRTRIAALSRRNVTNAAVVVIDNRSMGVRVLAGSVDYFDSLHSGAVNGAIALRQPGSAIKPFMYSLALERGQSPAEVIPDVPSAFPDHDGDYVPENYDRKYHGPVRLRVALACSYNVPAVRVLRTVGTELFLNRLLAAGLTTLTHPADYYGFGLTLGNGEVTLLDLTAAYALFAHGGTWRPPVLVLDARAGDGAVLESADEQALLHPPHQVLDPRAAFLLTDILGDPVARRPAFGSWFRFPFPCAVKTGTTKDYRDNWTLGYTPAYTVGVWVGNFDGSAMHGVSGVSGAGQLFTDIMMLLHSPPQGMPPGDFAIPSGLRRERVCTLSGALPGPACRSTVEEWRRDEDPPRPLCPFHRMFRVRGGDGVWRPRVFALLPPEYAGWVESQHMPLPPAGARPMGSAEHRHPEGATQRLAIVAPRSGELYKLDPVLRRDYQSIRIVGSVPAACSDVRVRIDRSSEMAYREGGVGWQLRPGRHQLQLVARRSGDTVESDPVTIIVE
jgi:penicillin-binding protein 1C